MSYRLTGKRGGIKNTQCSYYCSSGESQEILTVKHIFPSRAGKQEYLDDSVGWLLILQASADAMYL